MKLNLREREREIAVAANGIVRRLFEVELMEEERVLSKEEAMVAIVR